jgi:hypothetical protein
MAWTADIVAPRVGSAGQARPRNPANERPLGLPPRASWYAALIVRFPTRLADSGDQQTQGLPHAPH